MRRERSHLAHGILEAQQKNLSEQPSRHLMRLDIDMGGFEARRMLERLVAEEQNDLLGR